MTITQISVFVENTPGALAKITGILAEKKIDIRAMSLAETQNFGVLRLIVDNPTAAGETLEANNIVFHFTKVVAATIPDEPGGLSGILGILADGGINITYMYAFITESGHAAAVVLRISSAVRDKAIELLRKNDIRILGEADITNI